MPTPRCAFTKVPVDARYREWRTNRFERTVLVVVRTTTTLTRALDVLSLIEADHRIQAVFTHDPGNTAVFAAGVHDFLGSLQATVIPWEQARQTRFDLAIAASENDRLHELDAPILLVPHGLGYQKYYPRTRTIAGMDPDHLLHNGKLVPAGIALSHPDQREQLRACCPAAAEAAVVVGDPCLDRILASGHRARRYRAAFGAMNKRLVFLASTWGPHSLFGLDPALPERLLAELPVDEYRVSISLHGGVWAHSPRQVRAWLSHAREAGLLILPSHEGWRAAIVAASVVLSDKGSLSLYSAAADRPVLLTAGADDSDDSTVAGSPLAALVTQAPRIAPGRSLRDQIEAAVHGYTPGMYAPIIKQAVENPGDAASALRRELYRLMELPEPDRTPQFDPVPVPEPDAAPVAMHLIGGDQDEDGVRLRRYPSRPEHPMLGHQHLAADIERARLSEVDAATILYLPDGEDFRIRAEDALRQWPHALIAAAETGHRRCTLLVRDGREATYTMSGPADPRLAASVVYLRLVRSGRLPEAAVLRLGDQVIEVIARAPFPRSSGTFSDG